MLPYGTGLGTEKMSKQDSEKKNLSRREALRRVVYGSPAVVATIAVQTAGATPTCGPYQCGPGIPCLPTYCAPHDLCVPDACTPKGGPCVPAFCQPNGGCQPDR